MNYGQCTLNTNLYLGIRKRIPTYISKPQSNIIIIIIAIMNFLTIHLVSDYID